MKITNHDDTSIRLDDGKTYEMLCFMNDTNGRTLLLTQTERKQEILLGDSVKVAGNPKRFVVFYIVGDEMLSASDMDGKSYSIRRDAVIKCYRNNRLKWSV